MKERAQTIASPAQKLSLRSSPSKELFAKDGLRELVRAVMQGMLKAEMTEAVGAKQGECTAGRLDYRSGYYTRTLVTLVGEFELRVLQDRNRRFSTDPRTLIRRATSAPKRPGGPS